VRQTSVYNQSFEYNGNRGYILAALKEPQTMRLFLAAVMVVATFVFVALLISRLFPYGAGWAGLCLAVTCLYASAFAAWALFGKQTDKRTRAMEDEIAQRRTLRDNLLYFAVAMAVVTIVIAVTIHDTERGIHRYFKNDWFVGFGSACFALGYSAKVFWFFCRNWRLWVVIVALFAMFTAITIPVLSQMEKVPLLLMGPLANVEQLIAMVVLQWFVDQQSRRHGSLTP
jgi:hypothetical protein